MIRALLIVVALSSTCHAELFRPRNKPPTLSEKQLQAYREGRIDRPPSIKGALSGPLDIDHAIVEVATTRAATGLSPAGEWIVKNTHRRIPITMAEANTLGYNLLQQILRATDRASASVPWNGGKALFIESPGMRQMVIFDFDRGIVEFSKRPLAARVDRPSFPLQEQRHILQRLSDWAAKKFSRANALEYPFGDYNIRREDVFTRHTTVEVKLAQEAKRVEPEQARALRRQGFMPIDELAGGTPYYLSTTEGWVKPWREGISTFPETD